MYAPSQMTNADFRTTIVAYADTCYEERCAQLLAEAANRLFQMEAEITELKAGEDVARRMIEKTGEGWLTDGQRDRLLLKMAEVMAAETDGPEIRQVNLNDCLESTHAAIARKDTKASKGPREIKTGEGWTPRVGDDLIEGGDIAGDDLPEPPL